MAGCGRSLRAGAPRAGRGRLKGYLILLLDAHLPWVYHPEAPMQLREERWLFEAITESYLPLLGMFSDLAGEGVPYRLTLSLSPTLLAMLDSEPLREAYSRHLDSLLELGERELSRTRDHDPAYFASAEMMWNRLNRVHELYHDRFQRDLVGEFARLNRLGVLELCTTAATHAYLPLLAAQPEALAAQFRVADLEFRRRFGHAPPGWWLPECAYSDEVERAMSRLPRGYFFLDAHGLVRADPRPRAAHYAPIRTPHGWSVFGRDPECHRQVWHARDGYPADPVYREFYRDIGWDLPLDYVGPYLAGGRRGFTGFKYHRITGPTDHKEPYQPWEGRRRAWEHAESFLESRLRQAEWLAERLGHPPVLVAPYSAELMGHGWYEGPLWLESVLRQMAQQDQLALETPGRLAGEAAQVCRPAASSWAEDGCHRAWLEPEVNWVHRHLHGGCRRFLEALRAHPEQERLLRQAGRELLLAQSSDWIPMLRSEHSDYARERIGGHLLNLAWLCDAAAHPPIEEGSLARVEQSNSLFPDLDLAVWSPNP